MIGNRGDSEPAFGRNQDGIRQKSGQSNLAEDEDRLPWLDSFEEDEYGEYQGSDKVRLFAIFLIGLVVLGGLVGGIYWATHRNSDPTPIADGSLIEADERPDKEVPRDPGGKTFDGTGNTSFAVSEGRTRTAQLGGDTPGPVSAGPASAGPASGPAAPVPGPTIALETPGTGKDAPIAGKAAVPAKPAPVSSGGVGVQIGAFSTQATAEAGWKQIGGKSRGVLNGVPHRVVTWQADNGTIYRLQAVESNRAAANALCARLKAAGISCQVK